jgi:hypothetical protein
VSADLTKAVELTGEAAALLVEGMLPGIADTSYLHCRVISLQREERQKSVLSHRTKFLKPLRPGNLKAACSMTY